MSELTPQALLTSTRNRIRPDPTQLPNREDHVTENKKTVSGNNSHVAERRQDDQCRPDMNWQDIPPIKCRRLDFCAEDTRRHPKYIDCAGETEVIVTEIRHAGPGSSGDELTAGDPTSKATNATCPFKRTAREKVNTGLFCRTTEQIHDAAGTRGCRWPGWRRCT